MLTKINHAWWGFVYSNTVTSWVYEVLWYWVCLQLRRLGIYVYHVRDEPESSFLGDWECPKWTNEQFKTGPCPHCGSCCM